jgi:proteic killer suppression protein
MIATFGDKATEALFHGEKVPRRIPAVIRSAAVRKLDLLNAVTSIQDLRSPPGNRLELLRGDLRGFHSIRVNDQWRLVFRWDAGHSHDVRLVDYHR